MRVLEARPSRAEMDLSFAGLGDLLAGVLQEVEAELPEPQLRALRGALLLSSPVRATPAPLSLQVFSDPYVVSAGVAPLW